MPNKHTPQSVRETLFRLSYFQSPTGCRIWTGVTQKSGYGTIFIHNRTRIVHRVAWEYLNGSIPDGLCVCHKCDTPACIEIEHLFLGTNAENQYDKIAKGRQAKGLTHGSKVKSGYLPKGTDHWKNKLTVEQVLSIRDDPRQHTAIAEDHGINPSGVSKIKLRTTWKHVP